MSEYYGSEGARSNVRAAVKWFNAIKGFGFVLPDDGSPDAFIHVSVLQPHGRAELPEGAELECTLVEGRKGLQVAEVTRILSVPERPQQAEQPPAGPPVEGQVKFFNDEKGFGFIVPDDGGPDIFISARTLDRIGVDALMPQQRVRVTTRSGPKGPMAETVELV
jgi:CspA family cold shock protein